MNPSEFIYTVLLKPKPLRNLANRVIRSLIPPRIERFGATIVLNPNDPIVSGALTFGVYEKAESRFFCSVCKPGMTFLDIGANIGYYTALAQSRVGNGRIIALEPDPENFRFLNQTVAANGAANVVCVQKAAGAEEGVLTLYCSASNRGDNRLYPHEFSTDKISVDVCTIDGLMAQLSADSGEPVVPNLIKMDVQGFEGQVVAGMKETLRRSGQLVFLMEFWPSGLENAGADPYSLLCDLGDLGLSLCELTRDGTATPLTDKKDLIRRFPGRNYTNIVASRA